MYTYPTVPKRFCSIPTCWFSFCFPFMLFYINCKGEYPGTVGKSMKFRKSQLSQKIQQEKKEELDSHARPTATPNSSRKTKTPFSPTNNGPTHFTFPSAKTKITHQCHQTTQPQSTTHHTKTNRAKNCFPAGTAHHPVRRSKTQSTGRTETKATYHQHHRHHNPRRHHRRRFDPFPTLFETPTIVKIRR